MLVSVLLMIKLLCVSLNVGCMILFSGMVLYLFSVSEKFVIVFGVLEVRCEVSDFLLFGLF